MDILLPLSEKNWQNELPVQLQTYVDDKKDKGELCQVLLQFQYNNTSLLKSIRNSISFRIFDMIQFLPKCFLGV